MADGKYQDYEKGLEYLFKVAEADNTDAQIVLGKLYYHGDYALEESEEKSYQWFLRVAELKNAEAERIVGKMYTYDFYVEQEPHKSQEWLEKAVAHGDKQIYISIAELCMDGSLDTKDYSKGDKYLSTCKEIEAFKHVKLAHERGNYLGTFLLGQCYKKGVSVKKDRSKAKELLKIVKANGYSE